MTLILGLNAFHADASAALVRDGEVVAAAEEERFRRIKHWAGFPAESIKWCLSDAEIALSDVDHIAINTFPKAHLPRKIFYTLSNRPSLGFMIDRWRNKQERTDLATQLNNAFPNEQLNAQFHFIEHHRAHMASAFYASDFDSSAVISVDGFGDFASSAWGFGADAELSINHQVFFPHSLGAFYTAVTQFLGFPNYGDEYKVMGLAPYGEPIFIEEMRQIVKLLPNGRYQLDLKYFTHATQRLPHQWSNGVPVVGTHFSSSMVDLLGPPRTSSETLAKRHMNIARSAQLMYEEAFFHLLRALHHLHPVDQLCIAGGCGNNSVANGKISRSTPFKQIYVQAAAGDAGGALGSALDVWHKLGNLRSKPMGAAYLGLRSCPSDISKLLSDYQLSDVINKVSYSTLTLGDCGLEDENMLIQHVCESIKDGLVVGWFQGRMEWGPRALGHRSILGDPRRSDMKDILNLKIKRRESFRPFAPSVLQEFTHEWFDIESSFDVNVPYMMQVYPILEDKRSLIPAVTHVDGTGRLQTVNEVDNGRYYRLIKKFYDVTGVPMILNTSFNENEPIVCTPRQAFDCFLRTKMDLLVLDDVLIRRFS